MPFPPPLPNTITVVINGGRFFPWVTQVYAIRFYPGITVYQALASTGVIRFAPNGQIIAVNGVVIAGNVAAILLLNNRRIPQTLLYLPLRPGDTVAVDLIVFRPEMPRGEYSEAPQPPVEQQPYPQTYPQPYDNNAYSEAQGYEEQYGYNYRPYGETLQNNFQAGYEQPDESDTGGTG